MVCLIQDKKIRNSGLSPDLLRRLQTFVFGVNVIVTLGFNISYKTYYFKHQYHLTHNGNKLLEGGSSSLIPYLQVFRDFEDANHTAINTVMSTMTVFTITNRLDLPLLTTSSPYLFDLFYQFR